ncbi:UDP-phosphate glycosyltransferase [Falsarthrobacter nasiphocae]|uniref:UDP-N-acetylmuramyl pentapeptide phosphotransferase/UDP-N-acetylglucosamine-1-phosphate transferase n=1 Tax=Falsarthrobacter nasiphocae TaxID=189863 RepID=A0AAE3YJB8_9MICC|nr:UDP-phosphate glycosyltransferase [Falsarthrobacter nasiphocae]MDR6892771.1 UDP-N-acetylmuramyl pentapeptide phosphotransferase/UDP-N-acetylglucosamine-1-phosphate transferase [Falsarthrobacter nasiphocae]
MHSDHLLVAAALSLLASLAAPVWLRPRLERLGVVDVASARSSHVGTVVRGLGLSCVLAMAIATPAALYLSHRLESAGLGWASLACGLACGALGWQEDLRGVSIVGRMAVQAGIGLVTCAIMLASVDISPWFLLAGAAAVPVLVNAVNFMDGVNGISGLYGLVAGGFFALQGAEYAEPWLAIAGLTLAGAFVGFLPWNFGWFRWPASFMGDSGSYLLGGTLAALALGAFFVGVPIERVAAPFLIYLADTGYTLARRVITGAQVTLSHREHVYQRLTDVGFSHVGAAGTVIGFTVLTCVLGTLGASGQGNRLNVAAFATVAAIIIYLVLPEAVRALRGPSRPHREGVS